MSRPSSPGLIKQLWHRWKSIELPWRRKFLRGSDLQGNTFWEFKDAQNSNRFRRIVRYNPRAHYGDVKMSPQWIQWLRQTRYDAPSIVEQQQDLVRQAQLRQLAAAADERWARIPSYRDPPKLQQPQPAMEPRDQGGYGNRIEDDVMKAKGEGAEGVRSMVAGQEELAAEAENQSAPQAYSRSEGEKSSRKKKGKKLENPWTKAGGGDNWQPQTWSPGVSPRQ